MRPWKRHILLWMFMWPVDIETWPFLSDLLSAIFFFLILHLPFPPFFPVIFFSYRLHSFMSLLLFALFWKCFFPQWIIIIQCTNAAFIIMKMYKRMQNRISEYCILSTAQVLSSFSSSISGFVSPGWRRFLLCCRCFQTTSCKSFATSCCSVSRKHLMGWNLNNKIWLCYCSSFSL